MKRSTKRLISVLVCLAMAVAILPMSVFAAATTAVYCQAPDSWTGCNAYWWGSSAENPGWPGVAMSQGEDGIWGYEVPSDATGLIFNDGNGTQTSDLTVPTGDKVMYVFQNRFWKEYGKTDVVIEYYVAGSAALCGVEWDPGAAENKMSKNEDGTYSITYTGVPAGTYELKVTTGSWASCWGEAGTANNFVVTVEDADSTVVISFDTVTELVSAQINPVTQAEYLIGAGTAAYATDLDAWNAEAVTFTPAQDGAVTVDISACTPGFYLDIYENSEWIDEYFASEPQKVMLSVTAGKTYEFLISSAAVYSPTAYELKAGSVTYQITANVAAGEPGAGGGEDPGEGGENSEMNPQPITSYYGNYIEAGQTVWFLFDNYENMINNGVYSQMLNISAGVPYEVTYRGQNVPVDAEGFVVYEMMDMMYQGKYVFSVTNTGSYKAYFTIEVKDRPEYVISEVALVLGDNVVLIDPEFSKTLYEFAPDEKGVYTFTISDGLIGNWGSYFNPIDHTGTNATVVEWTCTNVGQSIMIGVAETEEAVLTVAKTGDYVEKEQVAETYYVNIYGFTYQLPENPDLVAIDVLDDKADVAVLDENGFYRYGSKYGPLMVADLSKFPINLPDAYINGQLRAYVYDDNGELIARYDYNDAMNEYLEAGLVPVTEELATMLKRVGAHHNWWQAGGFVFGGDAPADEASAWMVACSWMKGSELDPEDENNNQGGNTSGGNQSGGNQGGSNQSGSNTNGNPTTRDISMIWAMVALVLASTCLIVLKKKENFFLN